MYHAVLVRISPGYPPAEGRLHTCYSPVRRSPAEQASLLPAAPRLACVKPVASVHPEPGSNSPLLLISFFFFSKINKASHYDCFAFHGLRHNLSEPPLGFSAACAELTRDVAADYKSACVALVLLFQSIVIVSMFSFGALCRCYRLKASAKLRPQIPLLQIFKDL